MTGGEPGTSPSLEKIRSVKRAHEGEWLALEEVVAVGVGRLDDGRDAIVVSVRSDADEVRAQVPASVEGVPVEIRVVGDVRAL